MEKTAEKLLEIWGHTDAGGGRGQQGGGRRGAGPGSTASNSVGIAGGGMYGMFAAALVLYY